MTTDRDHGLAEIAALLAAALLRLQDRKSSRKSAENRDKSLDFELRSHGHVERECEDITRAGLKAVEDYIRSNPGEAIQAFGTKAAKSAFTMDEPKTMGACDIFIKPDDEDDDLAMPDIDGITA